jgi:uncharacterized protein YecE (DUF72 family)
MALWIGTSGWQYRDWRGPFYPERLPQTRWLEHYASRFRCVEVNNAFYRLPERSTFASWREQTPDGFLVAVKASRYLTHIKRLRDPQEPVDRLMDRAAALGDRLGPLLLQLPPTLKADPELLDGCLAAFAEHGRDVRVAVEPRHLSWWTDEVRSVLCQRNAALCWADRRGPITPLWATADWGYVRFHEGQASSPPTAYGRQALASWLPRIRKGWPSSADVFCFFNNDHAAAAPRNAETLERLPAQ